MKQNSINLKEIFDLQKSLDKNIQSNHKVTYSQVYEKIKLALIVELAELANEIRSFKFWSLKSPSSKNIILEEYIDGIHFITSICIYKKIKPEFNFKILKETNDKDLITKYLLNLFNEINHFDSNAKIKKWYESYLSFATMLGFSLEDIKNGYLKKNQINFQRQKDKY